MKLSQQLFVVASIVANSLFVPMEIAAAPVRQVVPEVSVDCTEPGSWRFEVKTVETAPGVRVARIRATSPSAAVPPTFKAIVSFPQWDAEYSWNPNFSAGVNLVHAPWWGNVFNIARTQPLRGWFNAREENRLTLAVSELHREVLGGGGLREEDFCNYPAFTFFTGPREPMTEYETEIRMDARTVPFYVALREAAAWQSAKAGGQLTVPPSAAYDALYSTWYNFHKDVTADAIEAECAEAAKLGMKVLIVDDGWQCDDIERSYRSCGDWQISKRRFPDMRAHVARIHALGMKYMMWFSMPYVGEQTAAYAKLKGKFLHQDRHAQAWILDPRFPEVRAYLRDVYLRCLKDWDIDGFKLDFLDQFEMAGEVDPAVAENYAGRDCRSIPEGVEKLLSEVKAALEAVKPGLLFEFRQAYIGPVIRKYGNMIRVGDCPGSQLRNRVHIANLRLLCAGSSVHSDMLRWHPDETPENAQRFILSSLFGTIQYSVMLRDAKPAMKAMIAKWMRFAAEHRDTLLHGEFRPHFPHLNYPVIEAETSAERIVVIYDPAVKFDLGRIDRPTYVIDGETGAIQTLGGAKCKPMHYLYSDQERIVSPYPCTVERHPYLDDGATVVKAAAGEAFGPLAPGSYLVHEQVAPGKVRTRYLAVAAKGWTVVQMTCGTTGDKLDAVVHARRIPMNYYVGVGEVQVDTTFLGWQRDYGDEILLHLHPDSLGKIDPKFKTLKENWEAFTVPEIVERLRALDKWMTDFGFKPLRGFASYTPANTLVAAMREVKWDILHSIIPEQNWSDGHWAINHWGMPNQPFYIAADDFRKQIARGEAGADVLGMGMNSYHLYMPHVVMWGDNVCSPSHFLRWHRTVESGERPVRYENFLDDYLKVAEGMDSPYFLFTGYEFGRTFGTRSMTVHNRAGCELAIDKARHGGKVVFATASDVADWFERFRPKPAENVFTQRDYLAGTRIMDKPIDSGPSIAMEMDDYKACFDHLSPLPFYHYDYTIPWHFKAADTKAPLDFSSDDRREVKVEVGGREGSIGISVAKPLGRIVPVCLWDRELVDLPQGLRVFSPPVLDDGRRHAVVELPKGFQGSLTLKCRVTGEPDRAEFAGLVTPLWRVQTIGTGTRRQTYVFLNTPLLSPCTVRFTCPKACRIDSLEKPLGAFKAGEVVELEFTTRRTWYRFWGLTAAELQPDAAAVAAIERAAAAWKEFSGNAAANLAKIHAADDAFFKSVVPANEKLLLDVDCFGNAVFGERSRARPFDRCVYAINDQVTAKEYSDGGMSFGKGKSFWVHPRGLSFQIEGLDSLQLRPTDRLRIRLSTVADVNEPLSYKVRVSSGWKKIFGFVEEGQEGVIWNCPKNRTKEGLFTFEVKYGDIADGVLNVNLRTNQKQILDDWFADGGFISRLERVIVTTDLEK